MTGIKSFQLGKGAEAFTWTHFDMAQTDARAGIEAAMDDPLVIRALMADETRPRAIRHGDGVLLNLRGVNLNPGAEPDDMVSLRLWITGDHVVSVQFRRLMALGDVMEAIERGQGPESPGELVARIALRLADRTEPEVAELNERIDDMESAMIEQGRAALPGRGPLGEVRRMAIVLRRYMFPQRDALSTLEIEDVSWLRHEDRSRLREAVERVTRLAEELDAIRDRAQVVQEQITDQRAEVMNRQMLVLSVVAAIFLPLGLITGLLGINVGGIPGANNPWAFWQVCGILGVVCLFQLWIFRRMGLIGN